MLGDVHVVPCPAYSHVTGLKVIIFLIELRKRNSVSKALNSAYGLEELILVPQEAFI